MIRIILVVLLALGLAACGDRIEAEVTAFHTLQAAPAGKTFLMVPGDDDQMRSLAWKAYSDDVALHLQKLGMSRVWTANADYAVFLRYAIDGGTTRSSAVPIYGQTGGGSSYTSGYVGSTPVSGMTYTQPTYGMVGAIPVENTTYSRVVRMQIFDIARLTANKNAPPVYDVTVTSSGSTGNLPTVMPAIIDAIFVDWPGASGVARTRRIGLKG